MVKGKVNWGVEFTVIRNYGDYALNYLLIIYADLGEYRRWFVNDIVSFTVYRETFFIGRGNGMI